MFFADPKTFKAVEMVEGETYVFQCPGDDVQWYYIDALLEDSKVDSDHPGTLVLSSVTLGDAGIYKCKNKDHSIIKAIKVQVIPSKN